MATARKEPVCVITGAGEGTGATMARRFAAGGYRVALLARRTDRLRRLEGEIWDRRVTCSDLQSSVRRPVSTAATNCAGWRRKSVPVRLREKG